MATILHGFQPAGRHRANWNGRTAEGTLAAACVYFARMETGDGVVASEKVVVLR